MGLLVPSSEQMVEVESAAITEAEYETDLELARAVGCIVLHSDPDMLSEQHVAIYPDTGSATVWWKGQVKVEQKGSEPEVLVSTMRAPRTGRNVGLSYDGIYRPQKGLMPFRHRFEHLSLPAEEISPNDLVGLRDGNGQTFKSHPIRTIELPNS